MCIGIGVDGTRARHLDLWCGRVHAATRPMRRVVTGTRVDASGDHAAGLGVVEGVRPQVGGAQQGMHTIRGGLTMLDIADGALGESISILQRLRVYAVQSATGSSSDARRAVLQVAVDHSLWQLDGIARSAGLDGRGVPGAGDRSASDAGTGAGDVGVAGAASREGPLSVATQGEARRAVERLDEALARLSDARAEIKAVSAALGHDVRAEMAAHGHHLGAACDGVEAADIPDEAPHLVTTEGLTDVGASVASAAATTQRKTVAALLGRVVTREAPAPEGAPPPSIPARHPIGWVAWLRGDDDAPRRRRHPRRHDARPTSQRRRDATSSRDRARRHGDGTPSEDSEMA